MRPKEIRRGSLIGREERGSETWIDVSDPATGETVGAVAGASVADCVDAVERAAEACSEWAGSAPRVRAELLRAAFEEMKASKEELAELVVLENGKTIADARGEIDYAAEFFRWFSEEAVRVSGVLRHAPAGDKRILVTKQPIGVSLLITPWNFPAAMAARKIGPALAAGCTAVLKPASSTPLTAFAIGDILRRAGLPAGVLNVVVPSSTGPAVQAMLEHSAVRALSFTGSTEVGVTLLERAAKRVVRCSMELGGNAAFIVLDDADVEAAIQGAFLAKMRNGGASCIAANRFYIHEAVREEFVAGLAELMRRCQMDSGLEESTDLGPLVSAVERDRVSALVDGAVARNAVLVAGGSRPDGPGFFYPATVLDRVSPDDTILEAEIFGPVAPIVTFGDKDDVTVLANATESGLASYVYSRDLGRALHCADRLEVGMVGINRGFISDPAAPFGGMKASGLGREGGHDGIEEFLETKYVAVDWSAG